MPIDRSVGSHPISTNPATEERIFEDIQQRQANANQSVLFSNVDQNLQGLSTEINSNEFRLLKLPNFWKKQPKLWFA